MQTNARQQSQIWASRGTAAARRGLPMPTLHAALPPSTHRLRHVSLALARDQPLLLNEGVEVGPCRTLVGVAVAQPRGRLHGTVGGCVGGAGLVEGHAMSASQRDEAIDAAIWYPFPARHQRHGKLPPYQLKSIPWGSPGRGSPARWTGCTARA